MKKKPDECFDDIQTIVIMFDYETSHANVIRQFVNKLSDDRERAFETAQARIADMEADNKRASELIESVTTVSQDRDYDAIELLDIVKLCTAELQAKVKEIEEQVIGMNVIIDDIIKPLASYGNQFAKTIDTINEERSKINGQPKQSDNKGIVCNSPEF